MLRPDKEAADKAAEDAPATDARKNRMLKGVAFGIGSAAIVAALLYASRSRRDGK